MKVAQPFAAMSLITSKKMIHYNVETLDNDLTLPSECIICFEPFLSGHVVSRCECMCVFHRDCLATWLHRSNYCPLHAPNDFKTSTAPAIQIASHSAFDVNSNVD